MRAQLVTLVLLLNALAVAGGEAPTGWKAEADHRWRALPKPPTSVPGFTLLPAHETGVLFTNSLSDYAMAANRVLANGSGVATGDFDGDGLSDIFLCGMQSPCLLFRNLGNWRFENVTAASGISRLIWGRGAVFADINGDGAADLLVATAAQGPRCFLNSGLGQFREFTDEAGLRTNRIGNTTLALADVDGNGTLDLYICNYRDNDVRDRGQIQLPGVNGRAVIPAHLKDRFLVRENGQIAEYGQADQFYLNDGKGHFSPVSWTDGSFLDEDGKPLKSPPLDWGLCATFRDFNGDGAPDIYVCNDFWSPDRCWINDGHGRFRAISHFGLRKTSNSSMGVDFADLDHDGWPDFFVVDMLAHDLSVRKRQLPAEKPSKPLIGLHPDRPQCLVNTLFRNRGDGTFAETGEMSGLTATDWSWSPIFIDVDLDGWEDLLISAGHFRNVQDMDAEREIQARQHSWKGYTNDIERQKAFTAELVQHHQIYPRFDCPIRAYRNATQWRFEERTSEWGLNTLAVHHGMAMADFDLDGDLDLVVNNLNSSAGVYRNNAPGARVAVRLRGKQPNTEATGARVTLAGGSSSPQTLEVISGGRYISGSDPLLVFGTAGKLAGLSLSIGWRSGARTIISNVVAQRLYEIQESTNGGAGEPKVATKLSPLFTDVSSKLSHVHHEAEFDDFQRQPLLPFKLSQSGPGVGWFDLDGDGHDDLLIGAGFGGKLSVYRSDGKGSFAAMPNTPLSGLPNDLAGITGWVNSSGNRTVLSGVTGYESESTNAAAGFGLVAGRLSAPNPIAGGQHSGGCLALGAEGQRMLLFIGGGPVPGRYPEGGPSKIYGDQGGSWKLLEKESSFLGNAGLVNGAVWADLAGTGQSDLVLACEWGPVRIYRKQNGAYFEITDQLGLTGYTGWWRGVTVIDADGDGRLDLAASNWGLNSGYKASSTKPLVFAYGELAQPGVMTIVETDYDEKGFISPSRNFATLSASLPFLFDAFPNNKAYSAARLEETLGDRRLLARKVSAATLESMVFLNRGDHFEPRGLPLEAQVAPAFGITRADFNADGFDDLFLAQNFFALQPELPRCDAGRGLLLLGDGKGGFNPMSSQETGIAIYGEQRGAAVCDYDDDGRVDLVVGQNGAETQLLWNTAAAPGLTVRLQGPPENPEGIGAVIRIKYEGGKLGPARQVLSGSGYWSTDSVTQIFARGEKPVAVLVKWPGGENTETTVRKDEIRVSPQHPRYKSL